MHEITIRISRINNDVNDVPLPKYATEGSSGMDIYAAVMKDVVMQPGETTLIPSGFKIEIPAGYEAQVRPRSGLALKHGIGILNAPGTIDSDYRGEVGIILTNYGKKEFTVKRGERIAQLVIMPVTKAAWVEVSDINETLRGAGGFGHTGTK
ncbi:MAG: dUTP diphosphatase [Bacteroidota bacterium]